MCFNNVIMFIMFAVFFSLSKSNSFSVALYSKTDFLSIGLFAFSSISNYGMFSKISFFVYGDEIRKRSCQRTHRGLCDGGLLCNRLPVFWHDILDLESYWVRMCSLRGAFNQLWQALGSNVTY